MKRGYFTDFRGYYAVIFNKIFVIVSPKNVTSRFATRNYSKQEIQKGINQNYIFHS